jgi:hypothetical protein
MSNNHRPGLVALVELGSSGVSSKASDPGTPEEGSYRMVGKEAFDLKLDLGGSEHARWILIGHEVCAGVRVIIRESGEGSGIDESYAEMLKSTSNSCVISHSDGIL